MVAPFEVHRPPGAPRLLYDSPHSGRHYPPDFEMGASLAELRRGEDAYVDELLLPSVADGAVLLINNYPRCYIDVNRALTDLDAELLSEPWPGRLEPTEKSRRGLGLIRRYVVPGVPAQARPLTVDEVQGRVTLVYEPYHAALDRLVEEVRYANGVACHVDWHSMKSAGNAMTPDGPGARRPDFIVSDDKGRTASPDFTAAVIESLRRRGFRVTVNDPYLGGLIVKRIGAPARGVHSVQVEINRALYLDEQRVEKTGRMAALAEELRGVTRELAAAAAHLAA